MASDAVMEWAQQPVQLGVPVDREGWAELGEWIDALRTRAGLTVAELADRAGVSVQWLQDLRKGGRLSYGKWRLPNPKNEALVRLAKALGVSVEEMLARAGRGGNHAASGTVAAVSEDSAGALPEGIDPGSPTGRLLRELLARVARNEEELARLREQLEVQAASDDQAAATPPAQ
jgi:transcriptional regulator with XRE-family HTH domain